MNKMKRTYVLHHFGLNQSKNVTQMTAPKRAGWVVVDSWPVSDPPPSSGATAIDWSE